MIKNFANRVKEVTTATDTSTITLGGAVAGFRTFANGLTVGTTEIECEVGPDSANNWIIGEYTFTSSTLLTRTAIIDSSNSGADVTLAAGSKEIFNTVSATRLATIVTSVNLAYVNTSGTVSVPLTNGGEAYMPQQAVAAPITFVTAANPVKNSRVYLRLVADGVSAMTFSGMKEWGGSSGYDNRNGIANEVQFFYDGYDFWFSISQAVGATAIDATAPTASSALVANATPTVVNITMSEAIDAGFVPAASAFTVGGHTVSSVAISGSSINLTCSAAFVNGEAARTVAYTQPGANNARDLAGNLLANFTALAITNNVGAVATGVTMAGPTGGATSVASTNFTVGVTPVGSAITGTVIVTPSDGGGGGTFSPTSVNLTTGAPTATFTYTPSATAGARTISVTNNGGLTNPSNITYTSVASAAITFPTQVGLTTASGNYTGTGSTAGVYSSYGVSAKKLPAGVDGWIQYTNTGGGWVLLSLEASAANDAGTDTGNVIDYGLLYAAGSLYKMEGVTIQGTATSIVTEGNGSIYRLNRTGTVVTIKKSADGGATFTTVATLATASSGDLYPHLYIQQAGTCYAPTGLGLV